MKNSAHFRFSGFFHGAISLVFLLVVVVGGPPAFAENVQEARVTRIVKDVKLVGGNAAARPAVVSDQVRPGNGVRTGTDSRAELTFSDLSITRLGANTVFSFNGAGRTVDLGGGAVLVEAPPNSAAIHVNTAAFSAAISGGTGLIEFHPSGISKVMILEGKGEVGSGHGGETITVLAGQMITLGPDGKWSKSQKFNVALVMKSANLITDFGALPNEQLIFEVIDQQKNDFGSSPNNQPPHDNTLEDTIDRNDAAPPGGPGGGPTPNPTPSGHVPVITSPNPYIIGSGTNILTDPSITTNGQTDQGVIFRGSALDGPVSAFAFDSTSAFDTASGFDQVVQGTNPAAVFKFTALQLTGNPTIDATNGPVRLGLIAVNGITSGGPGGAITFAGLEDVLLAAQNGSVTLGSEVSFSGLQSLVIYARGATSDLTLGSNISTDEHVQLFAERDMSISSAIQTGQFYAVSGGNMTINGVNTVDAVTITMSSFQDIAWDGETSDKTADQGNGDVTIQAVGNLNVANDLSFTRHSVGNDGVNLAITAGAAVIGGNLNLVVDNSNGGSIGTGGNIGINTGGNLTVNGSTGITLNFLNNLGGTIGDGGNISVNVGGNLTAQGLTGSINNGDGGHMQGDATISVNVTGNAGFALGGLLDIENNSFDTLQGGQIDGNAGIDFSAANVSSGGGSLNFTIHNQGNGDGAAGQIGGNATITIHAANLASASSDRGDIIALINNRSGGTITNNAAINLTATGAVGSTFAGNVDFTIDNDTFGSIGGDASVTAQMASLGAGDSTSFAIDNSTGGFIGGGASVAVTVTGAGGVNLPNQATFAIDNGGLTSIQDSIQPQEAPTGIGGDASVTLSVQNGGVSDDDGLEVRIGNGGNSIGGDATVSATVANTVQINAGDANFEILNDGGFIGGSASVQASAGSISANNILAQIDNSFGTINGAATISVNVDGDVTTNGPNGVILQILNEGGSIGSGGGGNEVSYVAGGTTTANALQLYVDNSNNGQIGTGGNLFLHTTGPVVLNGPLGMEVDNYAGGSLTNGGNVTAHFHGDISDTVGSMHSFNFFVFNGGDSVFVGPLAGGTIGTGGNINLTFDGNVATTPTTTTGSFGIEIGNDTGMITNGGNITVASTGNFSARVVSTLISNQDGTITNGANITFNTTGTITSTAFTNFEVINIGGTIGNNPEISVHAGGFNVGTALVADYDNEGGSIGGGEGSGLVTLTSDGGITVGSGMWVLGHVTAAGDVDANTMGSTDVTSTGGNINAGSGGIVRFRFVDGNNTMPDVLHTLTAARVTSTGGINFNGLDADEFNLPTDGGRLTINANSLNFGESGDIQGSVTLNGGAGFTQSDEGVIPAASGGTLRVNTTGAITVNTDIEATTGAEPDGVDYSGQGGTVALKSTGGTVTVNNRIEVSSNDPIPEGTPAPPSRRSASGGTILLQSNLTTGLGITVGTNAQLLSLLPSNAPGPAGSITLSTMGADIVVNGTVRADFGTVTLDQNDPPGPTPKITIDGATVQGATFNINGSGDLAIGPNNATAINIFGGTWNVTHDLTLNAANTSFAFAFALNATAGNAINFTGGNSDSAATVAFPLSGDTTFTAGTGGINAQFVDIHYAGAALNLMSGGDITANSIAFTDSFARGNVSAAGAIAITDDLDEGVVTAGTSITVGGNVSVSTLAAGTTITVGATGPSGPTSGTIQASSVTAGGDITTNDTYIQTILSPTGVLNVGDAIRPYVFSTDPSFAAQGAMAPHVYTVDSIVAPNGIDFNGNQFGGVNGYSSGGLLTVNANTLTVDRSTGVGSVNLNGADAGATDFSGNVFTTVGGDGGTFIVNATGDINANSGTDITATTGANASGDNGFSGVGGTVTLASTGGTVTVSDTIQVSSDDPTPEDSPPPPIRRSNSGGNITIQSGKATGDAIVINSSAQLLALLDNAATGPGGVITVRATGNSSTVRVSGNVEADRGTIDVEQTGPNGTIAFGNSLTMRADTIKVGALGASGNLLLGNSTLTADTLIALYGGSSNGTVEFNADMTLAGATTKIIAARTVQIDNGVTVTILGAAADVYAHIVHYDVAHGGDGSGGSFAGSVNTHIDGTAPPFGQTSNIVQANSTTRGRTTARGNTVRAAQTATTVNQSVKSAPGVSIQRTGIVR